MDGEGWKKDSEKKADREKRSKKGSEAFPETGVREKSIWKKTAAGAAVFSVVVWGYFSCAALFHYDGNDSMAIRLVPWYTESNERLLANSGSLEEAEQLIGRIFQSTEYSKIGFSGRALLEMNKKDCLGIIENQKRAIELDPYTLQEYVTYFQMLYQVMGEYQSERNEDDYERCRKELLKIPTMLQEAKERTSKLGWRIQDQPELELPEELEAVLQYLK